MDQLTPMLINYIDEYGRPLVQEKATEEVDETKGELKRDLPQTIMDFINGVDTDGDGVADSGISPIISKIAGMLGPDFIEKVRSVTEVAVETAAEGMDVLLTDGVMNIAKGVLTDEEKDGGKGGFDFDFLSQGKEGMVLTTMALSAPIIKQVSANIGRRLAAHFPAEVGGAVQEMIDENGGEGGILGMAAGFMARFISDDEPDVVNGGGDVADIKATGGKTGKIQKIIQKWLAPKILNIIQPYMQKFEEKMTGTLETELRDKVFSIDYIKAKVIGMLTGGGDGDDDGKPSAFGSILGSLLGGGKSKDDGEESGGAMGTLSNLASSFMKSREA